ncbi:MAG: ribosome biogenesis/translation initiation ATPase RLI [Nanohaloarchaea archaeon]|nr:ribosome biogenesis/translation initiation ATPase RLI [Candidatus Nanohaloarchaea archaeon]
MPTSRIAVIDRNKCRFNECDKPCIRFCPGVRSGDETIFADEEKIIINEDLCIGCGICTKKCQFKALTIINLAHELTDMVHQYGQNTFRLYGLPVLKKGEVIGLLGANGIGKSTALQILSGSIRPNLGNFEVPPDESEVIKKFRGTELQNYLGDLFSGKMKTVYKPQQVDIIPKMVQGNVRNLLKDERGKFDEITEKLNLNKILDRDISKLSGGELQRLAIAQTMLKDADVYYFDEPSSFLDANQRLIVARTIRELASEGKSVMVVEHDLATLDLLADNVHIVYGHAGAYGVISKLYSTRRGINMYLEGFIREENIRFRNESIALRGYGQVFKSTEKIIEYPDITKKLGDFTVNIKSGYIYSGEILGVFGANALGKTTFAKLLAGEIKPDKGKLKTNVRIAYKPQYLSSDFIGPVSDLLSSVSELFGTTEYNKDILHPLELDSILDNDVSKLSGGELQRVAIAAALSKESNFILLDEPSAYLDVEQRVKFSKMIRRFIENGKKTCMIIDHDILLLEYVSDRTVLFLGESGLSGTAGCPRTLESGMNDFLKDLDITFRKDAETGRPRANKPGSQKDVNQKQKNKYYSK